MRLHFLGTSAGVPTRSRNVSAVALQPETGKRWYLIDCGEATQHRLMRTSLTLPNLETILITHVHGDHCYGLPGLLASASLAGRERPLSVVGPPAIRDFLDAVQATAGLHLSFALDFIAVEPAQGPLELADYRVESAALSHGVASYAYAFTERHVERQLDRDRLLALGLPPGPAWGRLQRGEDAFLADGTRIASDAVRRATRRARKAVIAGDNDTPARLGRLCEGANVLVHEATYTEPVVARLGTDNGHSTAARVAKFAASEGLPSLILTHFSPRYATRRDASPSIADIEHEARAHFSGALFLARDRATYGVNREGSIEAPDGENEGPLHEGETP
ncbi:MULTISPECIES: ribonuclease Z [unclassified Modicisalibacter]|uniref:ribonuclease Z n=1 Tax=unclassified Modicisalibacter TaxID=2679913 RepID=UPI001CCD8907|nr:MULTISPECIES: ribonuclease Z [unclassified Modicisalibacter]MBZ9559635.1 ribonuclease Z [Modicisalibacter sp. R2A 31.J]MBZ9577087.1 ribonuclease Z [Modicisalibacter sp. MOD 31.J]